VAYVGPAPLRCSDGEVTGRRPVVGVLDTGCGPHPWLTGVVHTDVKLGTTPIGRTDAGTDAETIPDQLGPFDGVIDTLSGHGTFIAGLVHQTCPDADIAAWRIVPSQGPIVESELVAALSQIAELARRYRAGEAGGHPLDVLNLSMGYYHEDPSDAAFDPIMLGILKELADNGVVVVASAGNDSTDRPCYPGGFSGSAMSIPVVSVGALNPNRVTDALFSNVGSWVTTYRRGAALVSTIPPFEGGYDPVASTVYKDPDGTLPDRPRESMDPDDFRGQFAIWSGTSFSAPIVAGEIAAAMLGTLDLDGQVAPPASAITTAKAAVAACLANTP
jgi:subtilisin family serine protease